MSDEHKEDPWVRVKTAHGYQADEVISALQKEIRRGETENAALLAYEMIITSPELEAKLWQRLKVISVEDVGWGDLQAPILVDVLHRFHCEAQRGSGTRALFALHAVRYLSSRPKDRSSDEMTQWIAHAVRRGRIKPTIPDYALDMHTAAGRRRGRGKRHFYEEAARVMPQRPGHETTYRQRLLADLDEEER